MANHANEELYEYFDGIIEVRSRDPATIFSACCWPLRTRGTD